MLSLILPTYNEKENLPQILRKLSAVLTGIRHEIIVVDDDSPDETWRVAQQLAGQSDALRVIRRVGRRGLSSAVIEGFLAARGTVLAVADADGQHDLSLIPALYEKVTGGAALAVGSRYAQGGSVGAWDERRHMMSRIATNLAMRLCKVRVSDPMSGFFAIDRTAFEEILPRLNPMGFKILLDLLVHAPAGMRAVEVPFTFGARAHGESKLSRRVQIEFLEYLYDAAFGRIIPLTFVEYCVVGTMGVIVHLAAYYVAELALQEASLASMPLLAGIEAAIVFNFLLNNAWTFSHAKLRGVRAITGFAKYNVLCGFGALANVAVTTYAYSAHGFSALASLTAGAAIGMVWNYTMARLFTWNA
jgi:dolichol-phosphate mannosyltransferase